MSDKETTERGNVSIDGEIDAGFSSYWDPEKHGQTVDATAKEETGTMQTDFWPEHIDPEELTDQQREAMEIAFSDPTLSGAEIDRRLGTTQYTSELLRTKVPEWYESVFRTKGTSTGGRKPSSDNPESDSEESEAVVSDESEAVETDISEIIQVLKHTAVHEETKNVLEVVEEYV